MIPSDLRAWLASLPAESRDAAVEARLGLEEGASSAPPGKELIGYHASGVDSILQALDLAPVTASDVLVDLGAGLGKVVLLAKMLTGARARGIEIQPQLVERARAAATRLALDVDFTTGDARDANLDDGTVFFLYLPFTGAALAAVVDRLDAIAARRSIIVCALGVELDRLTRRLTRRPIDSFWLSIYDGDPRRER